MGKESTKTAAAAAAASGKAGGDKKEKDAPRRTEKALSSAMREAAYHVKDFMTDNQKALTFLKVGKQLLEREKYRGAIELFSEAANLNPTASVFTSRATAYKALNLWQEAYFEYSYAIRLEPTNGSFYCSRGICASKLKKISLALTDFDQSINYDPSPHHIYTKATVLADNGLLEKAIQTFDIALNFEAIADDVKLRCFHRKALCLYELRRYDKCFDILKLVLSHDPNSVPPRVLISRAAKQMGDLKQAEEQMDHALVLEEKNPVNQMEMGDIRFRTGQKYKVIDAIYNFDESIGLLEASKDRTKELLERYAEEERQYWDEINATKITRAASNKDSSGVSGALRSAVANNGNDNGDDDGSSVGSKASRSVVNAARSIGSDGDVGGDMDDNSQRSQQSQEGEGEDEGEGEAEDTNVEGDDDGEGGADLGGDGDGDGGGGGSGGRSRPARRKNVAVPRRGKKASHHRPDAKALREIEKQLADAYYRRSQCYVLLMNLEEGADSSEHVFKALEDAKSATFYDPTDDDFQISVATCYIRLQRFEDAMSSFATVLKRSPKNEKALFQNAFCQRAIGKQKDAVGGLTKIIAVAQRVKDQNAKGIVDPDFHMEIPLDTVYGTRGTLFHEMKAHKLALHDLGRAVALNDGRAENFFLRGDCHAKLGNYELALADFNQAEEKKFHDVVSLTSSRGMVYRLLGDSYRARLDFETALTILEELAAEERRTDSEHPETARQGTTSAHRVDAVLIQIRLSSLRALCFLDDNMYSAGHQVLVATCSLVDEVEASLLKGNTIAEAILDIDSRLAEEEEEERRRKRDAEEEEEARRKGEEEEEKKKKKKGKRNVHGEEEEKGSEQGDKTQDSASPDDDADPGISSSQDIPPSVPASASASASAPEVDSAAIVASLLAETPHMPPEPAIDTETLAHLRRMKWVLLYHLGMALHQQKRLDEAQTVLAGCVAPHMLACAPDDVVVGIVHFFRGVELAHQDRLNDAEECFHLSLASKWGATDKNKTLLNFAKAKLYQQQDRHEEAIQGFSKSIETDAQNAWAYFRRAWSYKAVGNYLDAGADFEEAKKLRWDDPNFSVDYKRINKFAYMEIESEPDISFAFPSLLPQPGNSDVA